MSKPKIDTIVAQSTPSGYAALSTIRLSGTDTYKILRRVFIPRGKRSFPLGSSTFYGTIRSPENNQIIDQVVVSCFLNPNSYTGEDCAEITTHGNPVIVSRVISLLLKEGARAAEAGEFTRRAFFNGKMDLLDVEATAQVLTANTASQATIALNQLSGLPSARVKKFRDSILFHLVQLEASLNFPEDAIEAINEHKLCLELKKIYSELLNFADNARQGSLVASGLKIALVGRPNSGKSSLMNCILGRDRAIVTDVAGTTRDTLEESFQIGKFPVKLIDTAGLRDSNDKIEKLGIKRTNEALEEAFLVIGVFDSSEPATVQDKEIIARLKELSSPVICAINKSDLEVKFSYDALDGMECVSISALTGNGIEDLLNKIKLCLDEAGMSELENMVLLGAQQTNSLENALASVKRSIDGIGNIYQDMLAIELEEAVRELGRISGETVDVNTLDLVFERFCIGK